MKIYLRLIFCLSSILLASTLSHADDLSLSENKKSESIIGAIMSPYCPGRLLKDCPSGQALQLKEKINARILAGETPEQIIDDLVNTFGEQIRASPTAAGFGLVAWLAPIIFVVFGSILTFLWLKTKTDPNVTVKTSSPTISKELEDRINEESKRSL